MLTKILKIAIPIILTLIILLIGYNSYNKVAENTESPLNVIPTNAAVILQCNAADELYSTLNSADIWGYMRNIDLVDSINNQIHYVSDFYNQHTLIFKSNTLFISLHKVGVNNYGLLFSSNFERKRITSNTDINSLLGSLVTQSEYNNQSIFELQYKSKTLFVSYKGDIVFFSEKKMLVEDAIRASVAEGKLKLNPSFNTAYNTISKSASINLFYNYNSVFEFTNLLTKKPLTITNFSEWVATDISLKNQLIIATGFGAINNLATNFTDVLSNQAAEDIGITDIIPESTSLLFSIGFDNAKELYNHKNKILQQQNNFWSWDKHRKLILESNNVDYNEFINELESEAGIFNTSATQNDKQQYAFFKSKNSITASSLIQGLILDRRMHAQFGINSIKDANITAQLFGDLFSTSTPYFTIINDYFIFGSTVAALEYLIDNYNSNNTLANSQYFSNYSNYFSSKSNMFFYINPGEIATALKDKLKTSYRKRINFNVDSMAKFTGFSLQMTSKRNLLLNNINLFYDTDYKEYIKEEWFKQLDTSISMQPQFAYNHFTKEKMIIVQNDDHKVFAINSKGEQIWSLQIESKILGKISSIDTYKNNKYQCLFNTASKLYLIDRNGKHVDRFPQLLPSKTKVGHALFDYNNTKKYRIIVVGDNNNIYNLDKKGNKVKGWKYKKDSNRIRQTPQYFRVGSKDYILTERNNSSTQLLAINGSKRVGFEEDTQFNGNPIQIDKQGTLYAITSDGRLWRGALDGNSSQLSLLNLTSHSLFAIQEKEAEKQFIYTNKKSVFIVNNDFEEVYSFEVANNITNLVIDNKGLVITTANELYLWNANEITEGFPISTDGYFNISDIDNNGKTNILNTKNGFIYNYELAD